MKSIAYRAQHEKFSVGSELVATLAKSFVLKSLKRLKVGLLELHDGDNYYEFGDRASRDQYHARIHVNNVSVYKKVISGGTTGVGEAYIAGWWSTPDLVSVIRLFLANQSSLSNMETRFSKAEKKVSSLFRNLVPNTLSKAKSNILAHYDLSNDFFKLFLDSEMMYSAAIYREQSWDLDRAAIFKLDHICQRLQLSSDDHLLEIGTGWGGMAIYAAKHYGCRVTTTTISDAQFAHATNRVNEEGLSSRITVLNSDYRLLKGRYDKLVSIEMVEAIGYRNFDDYFARCGRLLKDDGLALIQAITTPDQKFEKQKHIDDFIRSHIFPGGCLPSHKALLDASSRNSDLILSGVEDLTFDYAYTLAHWRKRFFDNIDKVKALGFNESFIRLWDFYLCYCEGGFSERAIGTSQLLFAKPNSKHKMSFS